MNAAVILAVLFNLPFSRDVDAVMRIDVAAAGGPRVAAATVTAEIDHKRKTQSLYDSAAVSR